MPISRSRVFLDKEGKILMSTTIVPFVWDRVCGEGSHSDIIWFGITGRGKNYDSACIGINDVCTVLVVMSNSRNGRTFRRELVIFFLHFCFHNKDLAFPSLHCIPWLGTFDSGMTSVFTVGIFTDLLLKGLSRMYD
jgi:hypothetical protein